MKPVHLTPHEALLAEQNLLTRIERPVKPSDDLTKCPYGEAGDILCAKEDWDYEPAFYTDSNLENPGYIYRVNGDEGHEGRDWRPSAVMPKDASRHFFRIKSAYNGLAYHNTNPAQTKNFIDRYGARSYWHDLVWIINVERTKKP